MPDDRSGSIVLHSSWTGVVASLSGAVLLAMLAVFALVSVGATIVSVPLALFALVALAVTLLDMPVSSVFDGTGVTRRAPLRHHRMAWDDVDRLSRSRRGMFRSSKMSPTGGLLAVRGRRNFQLVDKMEGHVEYRRLREVLGDQGERLGIDRIADPPREQPPTWLHRSAKWAPERDERR